MPKLFTIFKASKFAIVSAALVFSLIFNVAIFLSDQLFNLASGIVGSVTGTRSIVARQADDLARLQTDLDAERRLNREMRQEVASTSAELAAERAAVRQVRSELTQTTSDLAESQLIRAQIREATNDTADRIATRAKRASIRGISTMPAEAVPFWGTAVIASATALEIYDLCQNIVDIHELQLMFDPNLAASEEQLTVCSMNVPSRHEIWEAARTAPADVWLAAKNVMPTADSIQNMELPDFDWNAIGTTIIERPQDWGRSASDAVGNKWGQVVDWWEAN